MYKRQIEAILTLDSVSAPLFRGVFAMNHLPAQRGRQVGAYVINLDDHDEPGSHWVAAYDDQGQVEYMDSYGLPPHDLRCLNFLGPDYSYNRVAL